MLNCVCRRPQPCVPLHTPRKTGNQVEKSNTNPPHGAERAAPLGCVTFYTQCMGFPTQDGHHGRALGRDSNFGELLRVDERLRARFLQLRRRTDRVERGHRWDTIYMETGLPHQHTRGGGAHTTRHDTTRHDRTSASANWRWAMDETGGDESLFALKRACMK